MVMDPWGEMEERAKKRREREVRERAIKEATKIAEKKLEETVHQVIEDLKTKGLDKPIKYTHRRGIMEFTEIQSVVADDVDTIEEVVGKLEELYTTAIELTTHASSLVISIPGSSLAEENFQASNELGGALLTAKAAAAVMKEKLDGLHSYYGDPA